MFTKRQGAGATGYDFLRTFAFRDGSRTSDVRHNCAPSPSLLGLAVDPRRGRAEITFSFQFHGWLRPAPRVDSGRFEGAQVDQVEQVKTAKMRFTTG